MSANLSSATESQQNLVQVTKRYIHHLEIKKKKNIYILRYREFYPIFRNHDDF